MDSLELFDKFSSEVSNLYNTYVLGSEFEEEVEDDDECGTKFKRVKYNSSKVQSISAY